jgi:hypothetical protein
LILPFFRRAATVRRNQASRREWGEIAMGTIRRAAVTGLFAMWLAPLPAPAEAAGGASCGNDRPPRAERGAVETRRAGAEEAEGRAEEA